MDTSFLKRITDWITFQQKLKTNPQETYQEICETSTRMENTENINQAFRDKNYELTSATIQIFKQQSWSGKTSWKNVFLSHYCFTPTEP